MPNSSLHENIKNLPAISLCGLSFVHGDQVILDDIHLDILEGDFVGLIGPNGAGKTTLFKVLLGLIPPSKGMVEIYGESPIASRKARQSIGYVPQFAGFRRDFPITVEECVLQGRLSSTRFLWGYSQQDHEQAQAMMTQLRIGHLSNRPVGRISGGELQRVLLARALVSHPRILLLDEPTANVDAHLEEEVFGILQTLDPKPTILLISHDVGFISKWVTKVACLNRTLIWHTPQQVDALSIQSLYGHPVQLVDHAHSHTDHHHHH